MKALLKSPVIRSPKLMEWARGHEAGCQIRLPGCEWGPTCGSHIPSGVRFGKGWATKPPDLPALACDQCHKLVDGQIKTDLEPEFMRLCWFEGFIATLILAIDEGMIRVEGMK